jgi:hypothetical protein
LVVYRHFILFQASKEQKKRKKMSTISSESSELKKVGKSIDFNFFLDEVAIKTIKIAGEMIDETLKISEKLTLVLTFKRFEKDDLMVLEQLKKEVLIFTNRILHVIIDIKNIFETIGIYHTTEKDDRPTTPHLFTFVRKIFSNKTSEESSEEESKNLISFKENIFETIEDFGKFLTQLFLQGCQIVFDENDKDENKLEKFTQRITELIKQKQEIYSIVNAENFFNTLVDAPIKVSIPTTSKRFVEIYLLAELYTIECQKFTKLFLSFFPRERTSCSGCCFFSC